MSGAGRSQAADNLEDLGWFVIDNLPPQMLTPLIEMSVHSGQTLSRFAAVVDVRGRQFFDQLQDVMEQMKQREVDYRVMFLDAADDVLVRRYESVRRPHPLQGDGRLLDGAASLGIRPYFYLFKELFELYFFDFEGDLYGSTIEVEFHAFLRDEEKFDSLEALARRIEQDCEQAREALAGA